MAEVIDVLHKLSYTADTDAIAEVNKEFGVQMKQMDALQRRYAQYQKQLAATSETEVRSRKAVELLINRNRQQYEALSVSVGKQAAANDRLNTSLVKTGKNLSNLSFAGSQLLREAPAFTFSLQTGILALSNNIPILLDQLKSARAAGASTKEIFGALGSSVFGLTGLLTIGVSILTIFGDKLFRSGEGAKVANEEYTKFLDTLKGTQVSAIKNADDQISKLNVLRGLILTNAANSKNAFDQLKQDYPGLLKNIKDENDLRANPQVFEAIQNQLVAKEKANAATTISAALIQKERDAVNQLSIAEANLERSRAILGRTPATRANREGLQVPNTIALDQARKLVRDSEISIENATINLENIRKSLAESQATAVNQASLGGDTFIAPQKELEKKDDELAKIRDRIREIAIELNHLDDADFEAFGKRLEDELKGRAKAVEDFFNTIESGLIRESLQNVAGSATPESFDANAFNLEVDLRTQQRDKKIEEDRKKKEKEVQEKQREAIKDNLQYAYSTTIQTLQSIYEAQQYYLDKEIAIRRERVDQATALAEKGNVEILEAEKNRLQAAETERERVAQKQLQLNALLRASEAALVVVQSLKAVTNAAASGDPYSAPLRVAATVAAVIAGLAASFAAVTSITNAFKDGVIDLQGKGTETSDSIPARLSKGESVMTAAETKKYRPYLESMRDGTFLNMVATTREPVIVTQRNDYSRLEKKLDGVIQAIGDNKVVARQVMDKHGLSQAIETYQSQERKRWG